jgi:hypothetical protein
VDSWQECSDLVQFGRPHWTPLLGYSQETGDEPAVARRSTRVNRAQPHPHLPNIFSADGVSNAMIDPRIFFFCPVSRRASQLV